MIKILNKTIEVAKKSTFKQRHGCTIFKGDRIISTGYNQVRFCKLLEPRYKKWINSLHAEQRAILFTKEDPRRCSILVVRLNNYNQLMNSKPCEVCEALIRDSGITKIYYTNKVGELVSL